MVTAVVRKSAGERCGLRPGDYLLAINGMALRDAIDVRVYAGEPDLTLLYEQEGRRRECHVRRRYGEPFGLEFAKDIFNGQPRVCRNRCEFCFVSQMAPDLRGSLYIKDDDYRLSFLHGNYITLTNLDPDDWERIEEQYLSPLYVSVHATEPAVRVDLMRNPKAAEILAQLHRLAEMGIELHTQAVLVPGRNDGEHLDRTIADLAALYPAVRDLSVVPVGLTRWHDPDLRPYRDEEVGGVLASVLEWQVKLRAELGVGFVYPSDEWFLRAGARVPEEAAYDGLLPAMIENGVGMARRFLDERQSLDVALSGLGRRQTWVTGVLFAPMLMAYARTFSEKTSIIIDVVPVVNRFFGETVTVAGLLTVEDVLAALGERDPGDVVVVPEEIFRGPNQESLDGHSARFLAESLARPVYTAEIGDNGWKMTLCK